MKKDANEKVITSVCNNSSGQIEFVKEFDAISSQDDELLHILEDLQNEPHINDNHVSSDESELEVVFVPALFSI